MEINHETFTEKDLFQFMAEAKTAKKWEENADKVKAAYGNQYPNFWYKTVILSGLLAMLQSHWPDRY